MQQAPNSDSMGARPAVPSRQQVPEKVMAGERIAFIEEGNPGQYLKLIASGEVDDGLLEALDDYVKRQRKRLAAAARQAERDGNGPA